MVSSVAVLSDIHGVLPVLDAVLAEPDVEAADLIVVTGDHAAGPMPVPVLDRLTGLGDRCRLVRGNADRELVAVRSGEWSEHAESRWAAAQLRPDQVQLLAELPHPVRAGGRWVRSRGVLPRHSARRRGGRAGRHPPERWAEVFAGLDAEVRTVVCGHTHMPFVRLVDRRLVINAGSIGMPYGRPGGSWALLRDGQVELRHTPVDIDAADRGRGRRVGLSGPGGVG